MLNYTFSKFPRAFACTISDLLLNESQNFDEKITEVDICIVKCTFIQRLVNNYCLDGENSWPKCLVKLVVGDENENILLCYYYEIDQSAPRLNENERIKIYGSLLLDPSYDNGPVLLIHKLASL